MVASAICLPSGQSAMKTILWPRAAQWWTIAFAIGWSSPALAGS